MRSIQPFDGFENPRVIVLNRTVQGGNLLLGGAILQRPRKRAAGTLQRQQAQVSAQSHQRVRRVKGRVPIPQAKGTGQVRKALILSKLKKKPPDLLFTLKTAKHLPPIRAHLRVEFVQAHRAPWPPSGLNSHRTMP